MLKQEHWRCDYFAGKYTPETQVSQRGCETAGCQTDLMSKIIRCIVNNENNETFSLIYVRNWSERGDKHYTKKKHA